MDRDHREVASYLKEHGMIPLLYRLRMAFGRHHGGLNYLRNIMELYFVDLNGAEVTNICFRRKSKYNPTRRPGFDFESPTSQQVFCPLNAEFDGSGPLDYELHFSNGAIVEAEWDQGYSFQVIETESGEGPSNLYISDNGGELTVAYAQWCFMRPIHKDDDQ